MKIMLLLGVLAALLSGCWSREVRPEDICGTYRQFAVDIGRSGPEVVVDGVYFVFLPDGTFRNEVRKPYWTERSSGKWQIIDGKIEILDSKGKTARWQYDPESGWLTHTAYDRTFFPRGLEFILKKDLDPQ
ncbi:MAG: hypothetical protein IJS14_02715 [Lentisphaeria bacterium]|nr:hypothetical protein [Lentisphaeria bacterium]